MNSLLMQTKLGSYHDSRKEFGDRGTPLREAFWKKVKTERVKEHIDFLFEEKHKEEFKGVLKQLILDEHYNKILKQLRTRGYQIV